VILLNTLEIKLSDMSDELPLASASGHGKKKILALAEPFG